MLQVAGVATSHLRATNEEVKALPAAPHMTTPYPDCLSLTSSLSKDIVHGRMDQAMHVSTASSPCCASCRLHVLQQLQGALARNYGQRTRDLHKLVGAVRPALAVLLGLAIHSPRGLAPAAARGLWVGGTVVQKGHVTQQTGVTGGLEHTVTAAHGCFHFLAGACPIWCGEQTVGSRLSSGAARTRHATELLMQRQRGVLP